MHLLDCLTLTQISEVVNVHSPMGRRYETPNRPCYGISFCESGKIVYYHRGKKIVSDRDHAIFLPKGATYYLRGEETGSFPLINFLAIGPDIDNFIRIPLKDPEPFFRDFQRLKKLYLYQNSNAEAMSVLYGILARLISEDTGDSDPTATAAAYVNEHLNDPELSNGELARVSGFSEVYLRRLFREYRGTTPKQYILDLRLKKARELLADSGLSVNEVAEQCGFSSVYHFSRAFRNAVGIPPSEYGKKVGRI